MKPERLTIAIVHDTFHDESGEARLRAVLEEASTRGAELALFPELPLNSWMAMHREPRDADAEAPSGPRQSLLARLAKEAGIGVLGGAIVRDPITGRRANRAVVVNAEGRIVGTYDKVHLPFEEGYWEAAHYQPGESPATVVREFGMPFGIQICSDVNRPVLGHALAALGAQMIVVPRATPAETYERWRLVMRAGAITTACWFVSVNRPGSEGGASIGGPSVVIAPDGHVVHETTDPLSVVVVESDPVKQARRDYPGYLDVPARLYARAWSEVSELAE